MSNLIEDNVVKVYSIPAGMQASNESGHPIANAMYVAEQNAKGEAGYFFSFSSSAWSANTVQADMKLALDSTGAWWCNIAAGLYTETLSIGQILAAKLYYSQSQKEINEYLSLMSALDLKATLSVLENGIIIMEKEQISIPIDAESLMPLLTHSDRDIRLRAFTIAGNAKMTTTTQSANLR